MYSPILRTIHRTYGGGSVIRLLVGFQLLMVIDCKLDSVVYAGVCVVV